MTNTMVNNGWLRWVIGFLALLSLGAYGYAYQVAETIDRRVESRLSRIEKKLDCALGVRGTGCEQFFDPGRTWR